MAPRRPAAHRGVFPRCLRGAAAASLCLGGPLPPLPDVPAALTLQLTLQDVEAIDTDPAALARRLCQTTRQKHWLAHPKADLYLAEKIALFQRLYR